MHSGRVSFPSQAAGIDHLIRCHPRSIVGIAISSIDDHCVQDSVGKLITLDQYTFDMVDIIAPTI